MEKKYDDKNGMTKSLFTILVTKKSKKINTYLCINIEIILISFSADLTTAEKIQQKVKFLSVFFLKSREKPLFPKLNQQKYNFFCYILIDYFIFHPCQRFLIPLFLIKSE